MASRRELLAAGLAAAGLWPAGAAGAQSANAAPDLWDTADAILSRISPPRIPPRTFDIRR